MATDEDRREEYRIEALIDKAIKNGSAGECYWCGDITTRKELDENGEPYLWCCRTCAKAREKDD